MTNSRLVVIVVITVERREADRHNSCDVLCSAVYVARWSKLSEPSKGGPGLLTRDLLRRFSQPPARIRSTVTTLFIPSSGEDPPRQTQLQSNDSDSPDASLSRMERNYLAFRVGTPPSDGFCGMVSWSFRLIASSFSYRNRLLQLFQLLHFHQEKHCKSCRCE